MNLSSVNIRSSVAVYVQIENQVRFAIASGEIEAGDQLPSVRELSERIGVNPNTVVKAYRDLEVMGLLYTRRGMGVFINKGIGRKCREECRRDIIGHLHEVVSEARAAGMSRKDIVEIVNTSYSSNGELYGEVPKNVIALAKC